MKPIVLILLLLFHCTAQPQSIQPVDNSKQTIVFTSVNVIPMDHEQVLKNQTVVVRNGKIVHIGNSDIRHRDKPLYIDAKGKYILPGLGEIHAHVPPQDNLEPMKETLQLYALNGITTIRGMLGHPRHLELRSKVVSGEILGPRFYTSGPSLNGQSVASPEAGAEMVRNQKQAGYDFLKLHPGLTKEKFAAIAAAAKEVNIPFAGHVSWEVGVWRAIDAGYASIDHLDGFVESLVPDIDQVTEQQAGTFGMFLAGQADESRIPKLMEALRKNNIWVVPTQALAERWFSPVKDAEALSKEPEMKYMNPSTVNTWVNAKRNLMTNPRYDAADMNNFIQLRRKLIFECNKNGVGLLLGSDAPQVFNVPGFSLHHELQYMVDAGLTPYEALKTGTVHVGLYFNRPDIGVIKKDAVSDFILLDGNPLQDISQTKKIAGVMLGNRWLSKEFIQQELKKLEKH